MLYVALAEAAALVVIVATFAGLLRSERRATARERDLILNQLLNVVGRPWQPAPADRTNLDTADWEPRPDWSATPEQLPVY